MTHIFLTRNLTRVQGCNFLGALSLSEVKGHLSDSEYRVDFFAWTANDDGLHYL